MICSETAHVEADECGAPEFFSSGSTLLLAKTENGKLASVAISEIALKRQDIHSPKPRVVTLTPSAEIATVYRPEEIRAISAICREKGLNLHMGGARFSNACAFLDCTPAELTWTAGVDVLCFGGTKSGMAVGEAIYRRRRRAFHVLLGYPGRTSQGAGGGYSPGDERSRSDLTFIQYQRLWPVRLVG